MKFLIFILIIFNLVSCRDRSKVEGIVINSSDAMIKSDDSQADKGIINGASDYGFGRIQRMGNIDTAGDSTETTLERGRTKVKASVSKDTPTVGKFCKKSDILRVAKARQTGIQYCYEKELARNPEINGKVTIKWQIGLDGKVIDAWLDESTLKNGTVESCMMRAIRRWEFNKPNGGICEITFPFILNVHP